MLVHYVEMRKKSDLKKDRLNALANKEEFLLSVTENGFGKGLHHMNIQRLKEEGKEL